jgi:hypothetical protein
MLLPLLEESDSQSSTGSNVQEDMVLSLVDDISQGGFL